MGTIIYVLALVVVGSGVETLFDDTDGTLLILFPPPPTLAKPIKIHYFTQNIQPIRTSFMYS